MFAMAHGKGIVCRIAAFAVSTALVAGPVPAALAEGAEVPGSDIQQTYSELTQLNEVAEQSTYDVISIEAQLEETKHAISDLDVQIAKSKDDLAKARKDLSAFVAGDYKQGKQSLIDLMLSSASFDEFVTRVTYANKVFEHGHNVISRVDSLNSALEQQKYDLEQSKSRLEAMKEEQVTRVQAADVAVTDVQTFIEQLPEEVLQQVIEYDQVVREQEAQKSREILQSLEESAQSAPATSPEPQVQTAQATVETTDEVEEPTSSSFIPASVGGETVEQASYADDQSYTEVSDVSPASDDSTATSSSGSSSYSDMIARAYSLIGSGYQWHGYNWTGDTSDSSFTCSGVVDYALGRDSQSSSPETLYNEVGSNITTDVSQFKEGDLVFYGYGDREVGHVGVYVGDGYIIDSIPNGGVALRDVNYMDVVGGGSLG